MTNDTQSGEVARLLPCPFCGGEAKRIDIDGGENAGGSCIYCTRCLASSNVEFEFKENCVSNWNSRAVVQPAGRTDSERLDWLSNTDVTSDLRAGIDDAMDKDQGAE